MSGAAAGAETEGAAAAVEVSDYTRRYARLSEEQFLAYIWKTGSGIERLRTRHECDLMAPYLKGPDILDFPIGPGRIYDHIAAHCNAYGYDVAEPFVEWNKRRYPGFAERFEVQSMERITNPRRFDTVISMRVFHHLHDQPLAVRNVAAIVKPGGRWIFIYTVVPEAVEQAIREAGFRDLKTIRYDVHCIKGTLPPGLKQLWALVIKLAQRGLMPYLLFRFLSRVLPRGAQMRVLEKVG